MQDSQPSTPEQIAEACALLQDLDHHGIDLFDVFQHVMLETAFFQIPPDLVVTSQAIDMAEINSSRIGRPNAVPMLCRNRISRFAQLSTSEAHWSTTKSDGMCKILALLPQNLDLFCNTLSMTDRVTDPCFGPCDHV
jgi:hypothetical protein